MDLQQLATDLKKKVSNQQLTLDNAVIKQDTFATLLTFFSNNTIPLTGITDPDKQISVSGKILTITGNQSLFSLSINVTITLIQQDDDTLNSNYATSFAGIKFSDLATWGILPADAFGSYTPPGLGFDTVSMAIVSDSKQIVQNWAAINSQNTLSLVGSIGLNLTNIGFGIQRSPNPLSGGYDISFSLTGTFKLGNTNLTVSALVPVGSGATKGQWNVTLSSTATLADGIADLTQIVFGNNLFASLPPGFQDALSFSINKLLIVFSPAGEGVKFVQIAIARPADKPWEVVSGFTITGAGATFTLTKANTSFSLNTSVFGKFLIGQPTAPAKVYLDVYLYIPSGQNDWEAQISGSIENNSITDVFSSLPASNGQSLPAFPVGLQLEKITLDYLNITYSPSSKTLTEISFSVTSILELNIFDLFKVRNPHTALDIKNPTLSTQRALTGNVGGILEVAGVPFNLLANKPTAGLGWTFSAAMQPGTSIAILDLVKYFLQSLNITSLPDWVNKASLDISGIMVSMYVPATGETNQNKKYHVEGTVQWALNINSFVLPELTATVMMDYINGNASGKIAVAAVFLGLPFKVGYKFGSPNTEVYLEWLGIQADYKHDAVKNIDTILITFADMSLGEIITHLIASFDPDFSLSAPWDGLNSINLSGLSLKYTRNIADETKNSIVITYKSAINLVFLEISALTLTKDETGVFLGFEGKFLGFPITSTSPNKDAQKLAGKGSDVRELGSIPTPGLGAQYFDLDYLGLGQKVELYPFQDLKTVDQALTSLKNVFKDPVKPAPGQPPILPIKVKPVTPGSSTLIYSDESSWLVATKFTIIEAITLGVIFNDPNLYGLLVALNGDKMKGLNGLNFQILYKKVTDSTGVYQIELKLPDAIRELQFGAVSVTLPIIGIDIYTNGSFKLDFGFPYNMDFSRSLTIQAFPFTGSGGFYFAYLSNVPSKNVPVTKAGSFNPIIEFGLGLQLGVGKSINQGILKAGFSITLVGIFEGVIAFYSPNSSTYPGANDTYYKISATVGLVGKLYGEINFAIISATVNVTVYAYIQMVVEAYRKIPVYLEAGVSVSVSVSINLGFFSISISFSFSTTISASFTIGSDSTAPWDFIPPSQSGLLTANKFAVQQPACPAISLNWQPLILTDTEKANEQLSVYFFPQLTVAATNNTQAAQFANILYIDAPVDGSVTDASLNKLVKGVLYWSINAAVNSSQSNTTLDNLKTENVSVDVLKQVYAYLADTSSNPSPVPYSVIEPFLKAYFTINVMDPDYVLSQNSGKPININASILPLFPTLQLSWKLNGTSNNLSTYTVDDNYMQAVEDELEKLKVNYQNNLESAGDAAEEIAHGVASLFMLNDAASQSMPAFIFQDYILMVAKSALQDAIAEFELFKYGITSSNESLNTLVSHFNELTYNCSDTTVITNNLTPAAIAIANSSVNFNIGLSLKISGLSYQVQYQDSLQIIADKFKVQISDFNIDSNLAIQGLIAANTIVKITGFSDYTIAPGQTITQIAAAMKPLTGTTAATTVQVLQAVKDSLALLSLAKLILPDVNYSTTGTDSFENVSTYYGVTIDSIANNPANSVLTNLFNTDTIVIPDLNVLNVETVVSTFDTTDNIARISAMAARYFLHGMRLPVPGNLGVTSALYALNGQQFALPAVKTGDDLSIQLTKTGDTGPNCWMKFDNSCDSSTLNVKITDNTISRINDLVGITLDPDTSPLPPQPSPMGKSVDETFTLKPGFAWQYPGKLSLPIGTPPNQLATSPTIWSFSDSLINKLLLPDQLVVPDLGLEVITMEKDSAGGFKKQTPNYAFSTIVEVDIQKIVNKSAEATILDNAYEINGANDTGIVYLERLIQYMNSGIGDSFIQQIQILYPPDNSGNTPDGLQSAENNDITLALVQANLSTETNPVRGFLDDALLEESKRTVNTFKQFISYLWQCSITRTGGYYLYYKTGDGNGLPSTIFSKSNTGKIYVLITYKQSLSINFVNSATIATPINQANTTVYVKADNLTTLTALATPGNAGFILERKKPDDYVPVEPYPIPANPQSHTQDINYLNYQYNLIGYQLMETNVFNGVWSLLPIGPVNEHEPDEVKNLKALSAKALLDQNWKYNSLIPLAKNVKDASRIQPVKATYPAAIDDPYAGIGNAVNVRLNWQDMFGNMINTSLNNGQHDIILSNLYTDNLFSILQWPSLTAYYYFSAPGGKTQLEFYTVIDPGRYTITLKLSKDEAINNAKIDMVTYQKIYYQLIQKDIKIQLESSINADDAQSQITIDPSIISGYAGDIWAYLNQVVIDPATAVAPSFPAFTFGIGFNNRELIFELTVQFAISRTANVDPAFAGVPAVNTAVTALKPATSDPSVKSKANDAPPMQSLTAFATQFETSFKDLPSPGNFLKIAVGLDRESNDSNDKKIWVVHFDKNGKNGIYYKIDNSQQYFYAPQPLANSLETFEKIAINQYQSGQSYPAGAPVVKTFSDIDLDSWGRTCLEAIDLFLTAEYAVPAFLIDSGASLQKILDAKELIAEGIAGNVNNIIEIDAPDNSSLQNAKEKLKQQLLIQLSNSYKISTIVQNSVNILYGFDGSNQPVTQAPYVPQMYGDMAGTFATAVRARHAVFGEDEKTADQYTLSTAKIPLGNADGGASWLTYLFEAKEAEKHSSFKFSDMKFNISYIEHQIEEVKNMGKYLASSWLSLIIPLDVDLTDVGPVEIPIALRSYPTPPSLVSQQVDYAPSGDKDKTTTLPQAVQWGYDFNYMPPLAGQDQVDVQLQFNYTNQSDNSRSLFYLADGNYDPTLLPATLANFITVYPAIQADIVSALIKSPEDPIAIKAVQAFGQLITDVGNAWTKWHQVTQQRKFMLKNANVLPVITYNYNIIESSQPDTGYLAIEVNPLNSAPALNLSLAGYLPGDDNTFYKMNGKVKQYLLYNERNTVPLRNLTIEALSILERQNAWAGAQLVRNADLIEKPDGQFKTTNENFIYKTPLVKFYNELVPLLVCNESIYIAQIQNPGNPAVLNLAVHMQNLFKTLLQNANNLDQTIKVECLYLYNINGTDAFNQIAIPVLLAPPLLFELSKDWDIGQAGNYCVDTKSFTCNLTSTVLNWFKDQGPSLNNGTLQFVIEIYGNNGGNNLPVLKLNNLLLEVIYVKELLS
jgi:hypothetical protein